MEIDKDEVKYQDIIEGIKRTLDDSVIGFRPLIKDVIPANQGYFSIVRLGMASPFFFRFNGVTMRSNGIALSYECDDMCETLLHEVLHLYRQDYDEDTIERMTKAYSRDKGLMKYVNNRLVRELGKRDL